MKTKFLSGLTLAALVTASTPAKAGHGDAAWWAVGGLVAGAVAGAAIATAADSHVTYTTAVVAPPVYAPAPVVVQAPPPVVVVQPTPFLVRPRNVYFRPAPVVVSHCPPPVFCAPPQVVYAPRPVVVHRPHFHPYHPRAGVHIAVR